MLDREHLKRKLARYAKTKEQKYQPKTREEVLRAVEVVEQVICGSNFYAMDYLCEQLSILCERTRTLLNMEPPEGMEWKLVPKPTVEICCDTCAFFESPLLEPPCRGCGFMLDERMLFRNWRHKNDT